MDRCTLRIERSLLQRYSTRPCISSGIMACAMNASSRTNPMCCRSRSERPRSRLASKLLPKQRRRLTTHSLDEGFSLLDGLVHLTLMREVVGQRRMDVGLFEVVFVGNIVDGPLETVVPDDDVLHRNAVPIDARFAPAYARRFHDALIEEFRRHDTGRLQEEGE
jgi:hypothetical protein